MANFEEIIKSQIGEDGNISASAIGNLISAIKTAVGNEFVDKERYKAKLNEIDSLKTEKQTAEDSATTAEKWKTKYDALKSDFEEFKTATSAKETKAQKETAYRDLLKEAGIAEKRIEAVLKVSDVSSIEFGEDGSIKGKDALTETIKNEWSDFIVITDNKGADTPHPPANQSIDYDSMSDADYYAAMAKK